MIKAVLLIVHSAGAWDRIVEAKRGVATVLLIHLLPLMLLTSAGEFYGLTHWGKQRAEYGKPTIVAQPAAIRYEAAKFALGLLVVFLAAQIIKSIGQSFHSRHNFVQAFTMVAYGLSPLFLLHMVNGLPLMPAWVVWGMGMALAASALYQGVPRVMQPDPPQTFGLYLMTLVTLTGLTALAQFLSGKILEQQIHAAFQAGAILPHLK